MQPAHAAQVQPLKHAVESEPMRLATSTGPGWGISWRLRYGRPAPIHCRRARQATWPHGVHLEVAGGKLSHGVGGGVVSWAPGKGTPASDPRRGALQGVLPPGGSLRGGGGNLTHRVGVAGK